MLLLMGKRGSCQTSRQPQHMTDGHIQECRSFNKERKGLNCLMSMKIYEWKYETAPSTNIISTQNVEISFGRMVFIPTLKTFSLCQGVLKLLKRPSPYNEVKLLSPLTFHHQQLLKPDMQRICTRETHIDTKSFTQFHAMENCPWPQIVN